MSNSAKKTYKNTLNKSKSPNKYSIKIQNVNEEEQKNKNQKNLTEEEKEEINKQNELLKQIKECEEKLKFEQEQRKYLIEAKENEIKKKTKYNNANDRNK